MRDRLFVGPSLSFAQDLIDELAVFPAEVVVTNEMLLGVMAAMESAHLPCVALSPNIYMYPRPGVPPFGPGFLPATGPLGLVRDALVRNVSRYIFGRGKTAFNSTRRALGLAPLKHLFDQLRSLAKHLVLTSPAFDFPSTYQPEAVVYTGREIDNPAWVKPWRSPWPESDPRPLIIVSFSTTFQNHAAALRRVITALGTLDVRSIVTVGPALQLEDLPSAANLVVCRSAPHSELLPTSSMVITHRGDGTVIRSLAAGVPLLCMPMGRDQNDNAARILVRGVGLRVNPQAHASAIQKAVLKMLKSSEYRQRAEQLGSQIRKDARNSTTVPVLEAIAERSKNRPGQN